MIAISVWLAVAGCCLVAGGLFIGYCHFRL